MCDSTRGRYRLYTIGSKVVGKWNKIGMGEETGGGANKKWTCFFQNVNITSTLVLKNYAAVLEKSPKQLPSQQLN